jgi:hypothetical protein
MEQPHTGLHFKGELQGLTPVVYPRFATTHPSRNFFALSLFCIFMPVCMVKGEGL